MRRGGHDKHDVVAGLEPTVAMDNRDAEKRPAALRLRDPPGNFRLGHFRIVLQRDRRDRFTGLAAAAHAREGDERASETTELKLLVTVRDRLHLADVLRTLKRSPSVLRVARVKP